MPEWSINKVCEYMSGVQKSQGDFILAVSGNAGIGKSTLVNQIVKRYTGLHFTKEFFERFNIYSRAELDKKLEELPKYSIFILDESINMLFKREWQNREQIKVIQKFNTYRNKCFIVFLLIPRFTDIDSGVRNSTRIKWWINCLSWGKAIIYQPDDNEFNFDPWNLKLNYKLILRKRRREDVPNYMANLYWDEMDKNDFDTYELVKQEKRAMAYNDNLVKNMSKKDIIIELLKINPDVSPSILSNILNTNRTYVHEIIAGI